MCFRSFSCCLTSDLFRYKPVFMVPSVILICPAFAAVKKPTNLIVALLCLALCMIFFPECCVSFMADVKTHTFPGEYFWIFSQRYWIFLWSPCVFVSLFLIIDHEFYLNEATKVCRVVDVVLVQDAENCNFTCSAIIFNRPSSSGRALFCNHVFAISGWWFILGHAGVQKT